MFNPKRISPVCPFKRCLILTRRCAVWLCGVMHSFTQWSLTPRYDAHPEFFEKFGSLDSAVWCTPWSLTLRYVFLTKCLRNSFCCRHFSYKSVLSMFLYEITENHVKVDKTHTIGICAVTVCGSPVSHRLEESLMQLPSWPSNLRICYYCHLWGASVTPLMRIDHW